MSRPSVERGGPPGSSAGGGPNRETALTALRATACAAAVLTTGFVSAVGAERVQEFWLIAAISGALWGGFLAFAWRRPGPLLLPCSFLVGLAGFWMAAVNLPAIEGRLGFQYSNKLELSPRLLSIAMSDPAHRTRSWEQFGSDPLFYRLEPGSRFQERDDARNAGPEYDTLVDSTGFLNAEQDYYERHDTIDVFIAGDSVLAGVGMPGVVEEIRPRVPFTIYSVSTGGYDPQQKREALELFGLPKRPRLLVTEFFAGNDASESIEHEICEKLNRDFTCRLSDLRSIARGLAADPEFAPFGDFGDTSPMMEVLSATRADSLPLALGTGIASKARRVLIDLGVPGMGTIIFSPLRLGNEAITPPGYSHYDLHPDRHVEWVRKGLARSLAAYDRLRAKTSQTDARLVILYDPSSYEIYREVLPQNEVDPVSDEVSEVQRQTLAQYAQTNGLDFCDLTEPFRGEVRSGVRGLFGHKDGIHWSQEGTRVAGRLIEACLRQFVPGVG